jgi:hypothetical protein
VAGSRSTSSASTIDRDAIPGGHSRLGQFIDVAYNIEYGEETSRQGGRPARLLGFPSMGRGGLRRLRRALEDRRRKSALSLAQADTSGSNIRLGWD